MRKIELSYLKICSFRFTPLLSIHHFVVPVDWAVMALCFVACRSSTRCERFPVFSVSLVCSMDFLSFSCVFDGFAAQSGRLIVSSRSFFCVVVDRVLDQWGWRTSNVPAFSSVLSELHVSVLGLKSSSTFHSTRRVSRFRVQCVRSIRSLVSKVDVNCFVPFFCCVVITVLDQWGCHVPAVSSVLSCVFRCWGLVSFSVLFCVFESPIRSSVVVLLRPPLFGFH